MMVFWWCHDTPLVPSIPFPRQPPRTDRTRGGARCGWRRNGGAAGAAGAAAARRAPRAPTAGPHCSKRGSTRRPRRASAAAASAASGSSRARASARRLRAARARGAVFAPDAMRRARLRRHSLDLDLNLDLVALHTRGKEAGSTFLHLPKLVRAAARSKAPTRRRRPVPIAARAAWARSGPPSREARMGPRIAQGGRCAAGGALVFSCATQASTKGRRNRETVGGCDGWSARRRRDAASIGITREQRKQSRQTATPSAPSSETTRLAAMYASIGARHAACRAKWRACVSKKSGSRGCHSAASTPAAPPPAPRHAPRAACGLSARIRSKHAPERSLLDRRGRGGRRRRQQRWQRQLERPAAPFPLLEHSSRVTSG